MAFHVSLPILSLILLLITLPSAYPENSLYETTSIGSNIVQCGSRLLTLIPCAPFLQGSIPAPAHLCGDNLIDLYVQEENCLCILLNNDNTYPFYSINRTLAY